MPQTIENKRKTHTDRTQGVRIWYVLSDRMKLEFQISAVEFHCLKLEDKKFQMPGSEFQIAGKKFQMRKTEFHIVKEVVLNKKVPTS